MSAPGSRAINRFLSPSVEAHICLRSAGRKRSSAEDVIRVVEVCAGDLPIMLNTHFPLCGNIVSGIVQTLYIHYANGCISYQKEIVHNNWVIGTDGPYRRTLISRKEFCSASLTHIYRMKRTFRFIVGQKLKKDPR